MICYQNNCSFTLLTRGVTFAATWHSGQLGRRAGNLEFHRICLVSTHRQPLGPERMQRFSHSVPLQFRVQGKVLHGFCCSTPSSARQLHLVLEEADFERFHLRYNPDYSPAEDYGLWTEALLHGLKLANLREVLFFYNLHGNNFSLVRKDAMRIADQKVKEVIRQNLGLNNAKRYPYWKVILHKLRLKWLLR